MGAGDHRREDEECVWLKPAMVAEIEFAEWTPDERLRHASVLGLRQDKSARKVLKET
jgi:bifunctional non-homologous end joining protein LigD